MTLYHLIDAIPAAFFGLLGIWAAVVRRHWFLRFVVVSLFLLVCLLIPAVEVVVQFGIGVLLITFSVWFATRRRERFRFSLETTLLVMVVVAVCSTVISKAAEFDLEHWFIALCNGIAVALASLLTLWIVFGQTRIQFRLALGLLGILAFILLYYVSSSTRFLLLSPEWSLLWLEQIWSRLTDPDMQSWGRDRCIPTVLLGFTTLLAGLLLARGSGWFSNRPESQSVRLTKVAFFSRLSLATLLLFTVLPLSYLIFRLMTPTPYPVVEMPADNGWDDLLAAGDLCDFSANALQSSVWGSQQEAEKELKEIEPILQLADQALERSHFQIDYSSGDSTIIEEMMATVDRLYYDIIARYRYTLRFGNKEEQIQETERLLKFGSYFNKDNGFNWWMDGQVERRVNFQINERLFSYNSGQCQQLLELLIQFDRARGSLENRIYYDRLAIENHGWQSHLHLLLDEWSQSDPYLDARRIYYNRILQTRMLIIQLALQRYFLEHNQLPNSLDELVPRYLTTVPDNPFTEAPMGYQKLWGGYALIGENETPQSAIVTGPAAPYLWQCLQETWQEFQAWQRKFTLAPR